MVDDEIKTIRSEVEENGGIESNRLFYYVKCLLRAKQYEEANKILDFLIEEDNPDNYYLLSKTLNFGYRSNEAIAIIGKLYQKKDGLLSIGDLIELGKAKLRTGKVRKAKRKFEYALSVSKKYNVENKLGEIYKYLDMIEQYENRGAFIETEYASFVKNGNQLEQGHVVYLKEKPETVYGDGQNDEKLHMKNFFVWKVEGDKVYLFPLTTTFKDTDYNSTYGRYKGYVIYKEDYPLIGKDRHIKDSMCVTTTDNIISVSDKLHVKDIRNIKLNIYLSLYFSPFRNEYANKYLREECRKINLYNIIEFCDYYTKERTSFFISEIKDDCYIGYKVDYTNCEIIDFVPYTISKDNIVFNVHYLEEDYIQTYLSQIYDRPLTKKRID